MAGRGNKFPDARGWLGAAALALAALVQPVLAQDAYESYERALVRFEDNDLKGALVELKTALSAKTDLLSGQILLARIYLKIGQGAAAHESLRKTQLLGGDPSILEPLLAQSLLQQRKYSQLESRAISSSLPAQVRADLLVARGTAQIELGKLADAQVSLDEAVALDPSAPAPRVTLTTLALRKGDVYAAEVRAIKVLSIAPEDADAWYVNGSVKHTLGNLDEAIEAYDRALEIDGDHYNARVSRAGVLVDERRYDEATNDIDYLRKHFPLDPRAAYLDSVWHAQQGRRGEAREALQRAAALLDEISPDEIHRSPQLELIAGIANYELRSFEKAQTYLRRYMDRYPQQAGPRKIVGTILVGQGRTEEAIQVLEPALRTAPNDFRLLALLGTAYMQKGRFDVSSPYLEKAVRLSGGLTGLRLRLAMSHIAQGFKEQGLRELAVIFEEDPTHNAEAGISLAVAYLKADRAADAREVAARLAEVLPDNLTVLNLLASAQLTSGRDDEAELTYGRILQIDPQFMPAGVNLATLEASRGQFDAAAKRLESILERQPDSVKTLVELARVEEAAGRVESALRWMRKAKDTDPRNISATLGLAELHLRRGEAALALEVARDAESFSPENLRVLAALGRAQVAAGRPDLAKGVYQRMVRIAGFDVDELYAIARMQLAIGEHVDAIYTLDNALRTNASHLLSRVLRIEVELAHGDKRRALKLARAVLDDHPERAVSHRLVGDAISRLQRPEDAVVHYSNALELEPTTANLLRLFRERQRAGEGPEVYSLLLQWLQQHPGDGLTRLALAESYLAAGDLAQARVHYQKVLAIAPDSPSVLNNLAHILEKLGEPGAIDLARRAHLIAPNDPAIGDTLGWLLVRQGEPARGLRYLREAQSRASGSPEIRYHIGAALAALDREDEARRELRQAIASSVEFEGFEQARALLRELGG